MATFQKKGLIGLLAVLPALVIACTPPERQSTVFSGRRPAAAEGPRLQEKTARPGERLPAETNIHFDGRYCLQCHISVPAERRGEANLRYDGDFKKLCRCHYPESGPIHTHPVDIRPPEESAVTVPRGFPLREEKITCRSCHDLFVQCIDSEADRMLLEGQMLLRGLPYDRRIDFCYRCHEKERYQKFNPHKQIDARGNVIETRCLYCHAEAPDSKQTTWEDVKLIGGFTDLCMGCHYQTSRQPLHVRHLRHPSEPILARMKQLQAEYNIVLPLDPAGRITCVTCHNPHQEGLIPDQRAGARGAGADHRHRIQENLCIKCHPMRQIDAGLNLPLPFDSH